MIAVIGQLLALTCSVFWAGNSIIYSILGRKINSVNIAATRSIIALPLILILSFIFEGDALFNASLSDFIMLILSGVFGYFVTDLFMLRSYIYIGPRKAMVIMTLSPIFSVVFSFFLFEEKLTVAQLFGIFLTIGGIITMVLGEKDEKDKENKQYSLGILFSFLASFFQSVSYLFARYAVNDIPAFTSNMIRNLGGLICFIVFIIIFHKSYKEEQKMMDKKSILILSVAVFTGPVLGMSLQMMALTLAPVGIVTALCQMSPIVLLPIDKFVFKKKLNIYAYLGTAISIIGVILLLV